MTADPIVMKYFPNVLSTVESDQLASKIDTLIKENGWGFWAVELKNSAEFIGFVGLHYQEQDIPNAPFVEIGWRLESNHWGIGYATEAAKAALRFAFEELNEPSVYAFTARINEPSRKVMSKIGMVNVKQNFNHPNIVKGHRLERHCLYRISKEIWQNLA